MPGISFILHPFPDKTWEPGYFAVSSGRLFYFHVLLALVLDHFSQGANQNRGGQRGCLFRRVDMEADRKDSRLPV